MKRFTILLALALAAPAIGSADPAQVEVYRSPTCGCCIKWVRHLESQGFSVAVTDVSDVQPVKTRHGVPERLGACHTALVDGYVIEGHVPASDVKRLLAERPDVIGLAVPGMPIGSPGMEGRNPEAYQVMSFDAAGKVEVFASHGP